MRKILIIVLTAIMLVSLVACVDCERKGNSDYFDLKIKEDFGQIIVNYAYENNLAEWQQATAIYYSYSSSNQILTKAYKGDTIRVLISYNKYTPGGTLTATHIKVMAQDNPSLFTIYKIK